jgi:hypothetical protein
MSVCDNLLRLFLNTEVKEVEDIGYFKCKALLKLMLDNKCKINDEDSEKLNKKLELLRNMANKAASSSTNQNEKELYNKAKQAEDTAIAELNKELNGGSRRRRASKKHSKKHSKKSKKSKKSKSRRH